MVIKMAKKKKTKDSENKKFGYSVELTGLVLMLIGIIGFGFGPVGSLIKKFCMFLVGTWWIFLLIGLIILSLQMLIKRKLPKFFSGRLIGFYIIMIAILVASHLGFLENCTNAKDILQTTVDNYMDRIATISSATALFTSGTTTIEIGGGIIGCLFGIAFFSLFAMQGTKITLVVLAIFGCILFFDITISGVFSKIKSIGKLFKKEIKDELRKDKHIDEDDDIPITHSSMPPKDNKIIITSVDELKNNPSVTNTSIKENLEDGKSLYETTYTLPPLSILDEPSAKKVNSTSYLQSNREILERVLNDFQIRGKVVAIHQGPAVTQYEVTVPNGTKLSRISSISKEIALALAAKDVRIQTPIPGKNTVGVEIPNPQISMVRVKEILGANVRGAENMKILAALGKDIMGNPQVMDITRAPHLLVAGSTGSGKSVCINTIIASILMRYKPDEVKLVLVDPKKVELSNYNGVPHLLCPVVNDPKKASITLQRIVSEMDKRYSLFENKNAKNISAYNDMIEKENKKNNTNFQKMPYIVVIIDELADLMLVASKEVEDSIMRITQMARAAGIHLIVATQRPSTDVITGVVKANIGSRLSFAVSSQIDSRTILDMGGAEKLLGKGDMLFKPMDENIPMRIQGCFISDDEINRLINYVCKMATVKYDETITNGNGDNAPKEYGKDEETYDDPLYNEIVTFAVETGKISASLLQRRFRLGYNRAARIVDLLEERGIIGPQNGSKPREVLVKLQNSNNDE